MLAPIIPLDVRASKPSNNFPFAEKRSPIFSLENMAMISRVITVLIPLSSFDYDRFLSEFHTKV